MAFSPWKKQNATLRMGWNKIAHPALRVTDPHPWMRSPNQSKGQQNKTARFRGTAPPAPYRYVLLTLGLVTTFKGVGLWFSKLSLAILFRSILAVLFWCLQGENATHKTFHLLELFLTFCQKQCSFWPKQDGIWGRLYYFPRKNGIWARNNGFLEARQKFLFLRQTGIFVCFFLQQKKQKKIPSCSRNNNF